MTDDKRQAFDREFADLRKRMEERESFGPFSTWPASEIAAMREDAARVRRLMQILIDDRAPARPTTE